MVFCAVVIEVSLQGCKYVSSILVIDVAYASPALVLQAQRMG